MCLFYFSTCLSVFVVRKCHKLTGSTSCELYINIHIVSSWKTTQDNTSFINKIHSVEKSCKSLFLMKNIFIKLKSI